MWLWKFLEKMLLFFSYWTYVTMEILRKNVFFFWLLDLCDYGNCLKKCCFFLAIGLMWLWKLLEKMNFFTCDFQTLLWLHFGGSKTFFLFVCISRIFYNLRNHNVVKHSLVENRTFWELYDFLHRHGSLIKSMCTFCKNSKNTSVEVQEYGVKCRVILFQMSNYLSCIST